MTLLETELLRPVDAKFKISSPFGSRILNGKEVFHKGIDFATPVGTPVLCMFNGKIFQAGWENPSDRSQGFGFRIWQELEIDEETYFAWYGHMSKIYVESGQSVVAGEPIGETGNTGHSTGPHLHVGVRKKDTGIYYDLTFRREENA